MVPGSPVSPLSTGGAGTIFEYRVAAMVLAALIRGDQIEGLTVPVVQVGLQQRIAGSYLDDIVIHGVADDGLPAQIEYQVKRTLAPVASNAQWRSVVGQCVAALDADSEGIAARRHLVGVAAAEPRNQLTDLRELTRWARVQTTHETFIAVIMAQGVSSSQVRNRWQALRDSTEQVLQERGATPSKDDVDRLAFRMASALRIWIVEVADGEADHHHAVDRLGDLLDSDRRSAATLFVNLADIAQEVGSRAGKIDKPWLVAELARRGLHVAAVRRGVPSRAMTNLPLRNATFTGREELLARIGRSLADHGRPAIAIHGLGGIGKSQIALEYAHRHRIDYAICWWLRAESSLTLIVDLADLAPALGLRIEEDLESSVNAVKSALSDRDDWLLIFDNAPDQNAVSIYMPISGGNAVITSRSRDWRRIAESLHVDVMTPDEAQDLLRLRTGRDEPGPAAELAKELDNLPLALAQAGAYVAAYETSIAGYLILFRKAAARLLAAGPIPSDYPKTVATTWLLHFEALAQRKRAAIDILTLCAFMAPDSIPIALLLDNAPPNSLPEALASTATDAVERDLAVGALAGTSLLERPNDTTVSVHRLVQEVTIAQLEVGERESWALRAVQVLVAAYPDDPDQPANWPVAGSLLAHGLAAGRRADAYPDVGLTERADLLNAMAIYLMGRGEIDAARGLFERSLTLKHRGYGPDHPEFAVTLDNLGLLLSRLGDAHAARQLHMQALTIKTAAFGSMHPAVALSLGNLAAAENVMGDYSAASRMLEQAAAIEAATHGPDSPELAATLRDLGIAYTNAGSHTAAIRTLESALAIFEGTFGPGDPRVTQTIGCLAVALNQVGRYQAARDYLQQALMIVEETYGPGHPETARALANLGDVVDNLGDYAAARAHLERALAILEHSLGPQHSDVGRILLTLSVVLENLQSRDEAREYRNRGTQILRDTLGPDHPDTQRALLATQFYGDQ